MNPLVRGFLPFLASLAVGLIVLGAIVASVSEGLISVSPSPTLPPTFPPPNLTPIGQFQPTVFINPTETSLPPTQTACPPPTGWQIYFVQSGDSLSEIASRAAITLSELLTANCLTSEAIIPGAQIFIPPLNTSTPLQAPSLSLTISPTTIKCGPPRGWIRYTVKEGDTLYRLSVLYRVSVWELKWANCLSGNVIRAGSRLYVPNVATSTFTDVPDKPAPTQPAFPSTTPTPPPPTNTSIPPTSSLTSTSAPPPTGTFTTTPTSMPTVTDTATVVPSDTIEPTVTETTTP
ncbi:MAG: LysM peptidoglycan-binding domain-containing protein [Chloroflexota bacterium]